MAMVLMNQVEKSGVKVRAAIFTLNDIHIDTGSGAELNTGEIIYISFKISSPMSSQSAKKRRILSTVGVIHGHHFTTESNR